MAGTIARPTSPSTLCFFRGVGPHRELHSFPTRRSSDLSPKSTRPCSSNQSTPDFTWTCIDCGARKTRPSASTRQRSEEHTSELQSRLHLVCRLLLEKKNARHTASRPRHHPNRGTTHQTR